MRLVRGRSETHPRPKLKVNGPTFVALTEYRAVHSGNSAPFQEQLVPLAAKRQSAIHFQQNDQVSVGAGCERVRAHAGVLVVANGFFLQKPTTAMTDEVTQSGQCPVPLSLTSMNTP